MRSIDLKHALDNSADNFTCKLFQLFLKADNQNFSQLAKVYPIEASMVYAYRKTGVIPEVE